MKYRCIILASLFVFFLIACEKESSKTPVVSDEITIDSLIATLYSVKAWDTTTITCYATGADLIYQWECDHGNFSGSGMQVKYGAGECCVGTNNITCKVSNHTGQVKESIQIVVTSYFGGGK
jgi:hypothetical protein